MWRTIGGLAALILILGVFTGAHLDVREQDSDSYLSGLFDEPGYDGHPFSHEEYLRPREFPVIGGVCFIFDDGDTSFYTEFVRMSDEIYDSCGIRIRGTILIIPSLVGESERELTVDQLVDINTRQQDFEIGCHGDASQIMGASLPGMSYSFMDSLLDSYQDSARTWGISCFRSFGYPLWRMQLGMGELWLKNGIYQAKSFRVMVHDTVRNDAPGWVQWDSPTQMQVNCDQFPSSSADIGSWINDDYYGYQRIGGMLNDYDVGSRTYSSKASDSPGGVPDTLKKYIDLAAQTFRIGLVTMHNIDTIQPGGDSLEIPPDSLYQIMLHAAHRIDEGILESYTLEQACARMRGIPSGELLPNHGFRLLNDGIASLWAEADTIPIGWPFLEGLYYAASGRWINGNSERWTVHDLSAVDTVYEAYDALGKPESTTYGLSDTSRNIAISKAFSVWGASMEMPIYVWTTGTEAKFVDITIQACVYADTASDLYVRARFADFEELQDDFINATDDGYDYMINIVGGRTTGSSDTEPPDRSRMRLLSSYAYRDTTDEIAYHAGLYNSSLGKIHWTAPNVLRPYIIDERGDHSGVRWEVEGSFGNFYDIKAAGNAANRHTAEFPLYHTQMQWRTWVFRVPIVPGRSDCICGIFGFENYQVSLGTTDLVIMISDISAHAVQ